MKLDFRYSKNTFFFFMIFAFGFFHNHNVNISNDFASSPVRKKVSFFYFALLSVPFLSIYLIRQNKNDQKTELLIDKLIFQRGLVDLENNKFNKYQEDQLKKNQQK